MLIVDNSNILFATNWENGVNSKADNFFGLYSTNKSLVQNFGSLFDTLLNEKEILESIIKIKTQLEGSNKLLEDSNRKLLIHTKAQEDFINLAAHELRTPIHTILGYIELLDLGPNFRGNNNDDDNQRYVDSIIRNSKRLEKLVEDLLDTTRIESHTLKLNKENTNIFDLINTVVESYRMELEVKRGKTRIKDIEVEKEENNSVKQLKQQQHQQQKKLHLEDDVEILVLSDDNNNNNNRNEIKSNFSDYNVDVDRSKIIQVVSNIIGNSLTSIYNKNKSNRNEIDNKLDHHNVISITVSKNVQFADKNAKNDISSGSFNSFTKKENNDNEILLIRIKDTGRGIDPTISSKLFEKFTTSSSSGTGLGLYIVKAIIEAHGGNIWAENNTVVKESGATFSFTIPIKSDLNDQGQYD